MGTEFTISKQVTFSQPKDSVRAITAGPLIHPKLLITGQICTRVPNNERTRQSVKLHDATTTGDHRLVQKSLMVTKDTKGILDRSMGGVLHMKILSLLLLSSIFVVGQTATSPVQHGNIEILSDTQGVDFGPYLQDISKIIRHNWYILIPESAEQKKAEVAIEFAIAKDGHVSDMRLSASSGDAALDRPAWGSITNSNPFPLLPREFKGPYLALRLHFAYNLEKNFLAKSAKGNTGETAPNSKSGIVVNISAIGSLQVPAGGSQVVTATVTGTEEKVVEWSVTGSSCSGSACGKLIGDLYVAPSSVPSLPYVTLTARAKADPTAKASVTFHIVQPSQPR
jgi:TonB family protein